MPSQDLYVVIHDVAPPNAREIRALLELLQPFDMPVHAAVVPRWRQGERSSGALDWEASARRLVDSFDAVLVHGWTHRRHRGRWRSPISWATDASDELAGLKLRELGERLELALAETRTLAGRDPVGLLPPAWRLPRQADRVAFSRGYPRVLRFDSIAEPATRRSLTTWSWDWGWAGRPAARLLEAASGLRAVVRSEARCVALHPADVRRGLLPRIRACLESRLSAGDLPRLLGAAV